MSNPANLRLWTDRRADSTFEDIPVIDFTNASSTDFAARRQLADQIRDACINVGFFYITNHDIPQDVISKTVQAAKTFFSLPIASKMDLDIRKSPNFKGYTSLLSENADPSGKGDLHEGFDIGWEEPEALTTTQTSRNDGSMSGSNVWPPDLPDFRASVLGYYHAAVHLGQSLFPLFALALDLPENFFDDKTTKPAAIMRLLHYPPQPPISPDIDQLRDGSIGIGAHTDYEASTSTDPIVTANVRKNSVGGLQVQNNEGKWIDAVPIPGSLVLNLGDQFARWTNDVFRSTMHRAINRSGEERYSIPLFFGTDYDVLLEAIPSCVTPDNPAKYAVVTAGDYVKSRLEATYIKA